MMLRQLPNLITILRILLLFPLMYFLHLEEYTISLYIFAVAGLSDALDGFLAKQFDWQSRFGAILDPLADKSLLVITMALLTYNGHIDWMLFIIVAFRDLYIVAGASYYHYRVGPYQMQPSMLSKFNTFVQLLLVTCLLFSLGYKSFPETFILALVILTYFTTISSGIHYTVVWSKKLKLAIKGQEL